MEHFYSTLQQNTSTEHFNRVLGKGFVDLKNVKTDFLTAVGTQSHLHRTLQQLQRQLCRKTNELFFSELLDLATGGDFNLDVEEDVSKKFFLRRQMWEKCVVICKY